MEFYHLRTFEAVAEERSITRAARKLFTTPPSVSAHIKSLEEEWNATLFRRTSKSMEITKKGELLLGKVKAALSAAEELSSSAAKLMDCLLGSLRVGLYAPENL